MRNWHTSGLAWSSSMSNADKARCGRESGAAPTRAPAGRAAAPRSVPRGGFARIGRARRLSCHVAERRIVPNARGWCEPRVISAPDERHGITGRYGHGNGAACGRNGAHTRPIGRRCGSSLRPSEAQAGTKISKVGDRCGAWTRGRRRRVQAVDLANLGPPHTDMNEARCRHLVLPPTFGQISVLV